MIDLRPLQPSAFHYRTIGKRNRKHFEQPAIR